MARLVGAFSNWAKLDNWVGWITALVFYFLPGVDKTDGQTDRQTDGYQQQQRVSIFGVVVFFSSTTLTHRSIDGDKGMKWWWEGGEFG